MSEEALEERKILEIGCGIALPSIIIKKLGGDITASDLHPLANLFLKKNLVLNSIGPIPFDSRNWNTKEENLKKYDLMIASDVLYEKRHINLLVSFIRRHSHRNTKVILVDPGRGSHRAFGRAMKHIGFDHTWSDLSEFSLGAKEKGFIFRFSQKRYLK